jgi:hypothetical protein
MHIIENRLESEVFGTPALEAILNRVKDLELIVAGGAEGAWRGGFPGTVFNADPNATMSQTKINDVVDAIEDYIHGFKRELLLQGVTPFQLSPQVQDISKQFEVEVTLIAAATGIPRRVLLGPEKGELGSGRDDAAMQSWWDDIEERCSNYCEPWILRPLIDRLISLGVLPAPSEGYTIVWPNRRWRDPKSEAETGEIKARALSEYVGSVGADMIVPPDVFLEDILGFTRNRIAQIEEILGGIGNLADGEGKAE